MEVIWGNRLKPGDYKYIGSFPHFVADAGDDRVGRWLDEKIDLGRVYAEIWRKRRRPTWSPCFVTATTRTRQHHLFRLRPARTAVRLGQLVAVMQAVRRCRD
jgi:hypothetical protein